MPVISHHPVIIHFESIGGDGLTIEIELSIFHGKVIILAIADGTLIHRIIFGREGPALLLLEYQMGP